MTVGVVVAVRDGALTIERALRSVLAERTAEGETCTVDDVVVVDGGSTDDTCEVAMSVPGVRVVQQHGRGLGGARNQGVQEVRGEFIAFLDADDHWPEQSLDRRVNHLLATPEAAGVVGQLVADVLPGEAVPDLNRDRIGQPIPGYTPGALVVRRGIFHTVGTFDTDLAIGCDSDWFVRAIGTGHRIDVVPEVVLFKGIRSSSLAHDVAAYRRELLTIARRFVATRSRPT